MYAPEVLLKKPEVQLLWANIFRNTCGPDEINISSPFQQASILSEAPSHSVVGDMSDWFFPLYLEMGHFEVQEL